MIGWPKVVSDLKMFHVLFSEYARPHAGFSPGTLPRTSLGLPPQCIDPMLHYQLNSMYGPSARERWVLPSAMSNRFSLVSNVTKTAD